MMIYFSDLCYYNDTVRIAVTIGGCCYSFIKLVYAPASKGELCPGDINGPAVSVGIIYSTIN